MNQRGNTIYNQSAQKNIPGRMNTLANNNNNIYRVNDKDQQKKHIEIIYNFLAEQKDFNNMITLKQLQSPSGKQFQMVFIFLLNIYDPQFSLEAMTNEQIPIYMKYIVGYPYTLQKNMFVTIGAPHTIGSILHMLQWFIGIIRAGSKKQVSDLQQVNSQQQDVNFEGFDNNISDINKEQLISDSVHEIYVQPKNNNNNNNNITNYETQSDISEQQIDNLRNRVQNRLQQYSNQVKQQLKNEQDRFFASCENIDSIKQQQPELSEIQHQINFQKEKVFKEEKLSQQITLKIQENTQKEEDNNKTISKLRMQQDQVQKQVQDVQSVVENQEIDMLEAQRIDSQINNLKQVKDNLIKHHTEKVQLKKKYNQEILDQNSVADELLNQYNQILTQNSVEFAQKSKNIIAQLNQQFLNQFTQDSVVLEAIENGQIDPVIAKFLKFSMEKDALKFLLTETQKLNIETNNKHKNIQELQDQLEIFKNQTREKQMERNTLEHQKKCSMELATTVHDSYYKNVEQNNKEEQNLVEKLKNCKIKQVQYSDQIKKVTNETSQLIQQMEKQSKEGDQVKIYLTKQKEELIQQALLSKEKQKNKLQEILDTQIEENKKLEQLYLQQQKLDSQIQYNILQQ